ncbi:hypothetical protein GJ744_002132 [Endocarpon pusillum]|uniref:Uncharacterized protein n=1 Tax=Endocarpon pusillum TaxID=364733 RepID=A0A8H7AB48_9EURO|nr:hypothetical protein GJ744_002132 [Endocarpon pusillum]
MTSCLSVFIFLAVKLAFATPEAALTQQPLHRITKPMTTTTPLPTLTSCPSLGKRQDSSYPTICGYSNGVQQAARTAEPGWACTTDVVHGLWGFCQTSAYAAGQCTLGGNCVDEFACTTGCGTVGDAAVGTFRW